jgi:hypothetical protein
MKAQRMIYSVIFGLLLVSPLSWLTHPVSAATLHAIIVCNTVDEYIGAAVALDLEQMRQEIQTIARYTGMPLQLTELAGATLNRTAVMNAVNGLQPAADDAVIFYFSGHGFSLQTKDPWPYMEMLQDEALDEKWVFDTLLTKQPRLLLVLSDSCNNVIPEIYAPDTGMKRQLKAGGNVQANYQALFLHARGAFLASSSRHDEASSTFSNGSAFTLQFLSALQNAMMFSQQPTWQNVMEVAIQPILVEGEYQHPQYAEITLPAETVPALPTASPVFTVTPTPFLQSPPQRPLPWTRVPQLASTPTPHPIPAPRSTATPAPSPQPTALPRATDLSQTDCEQAESVLTIQLYGTDNLLRFVLVTDAGHTGEYTLRDRFQEYTAQLAVGKRATVYLHGERNEMVIPHELSLCVYYEDTGAENKVYIKE